MVYKRNLHYIEKMNDNREGNQRVIINVQLFVGMRTLHMYLFTRNSSHRFVNFLFYFYIEIFLFKLSTDTHS